MASLGLRGGRSGRRWGVAGDALGVAGASQKLLSALLEPRRRHSERRWGLGNVSLQFNALFHCNACSGFQCFPSLHNFILVSMLSFTSRVFLAGRLIRSSQSMREVEICLYPPGLDRFGARIGGVRWKSVPSRRHSRMWCHHVIGRDGWEWVEQGACYEVIPPTRWGKNP